MLLGYQEREKSILPGRLEGGLHEGTVELGSMYAGRILTLGGHHETQVGYEQPVKKSRVDSNTPWPEYSLHERSTLIGRGGMYL